jgi:hypothetical protein
MIDQLQAIQSALTAGDKARAMALIQPLLVSSPSADLYVLASMASDTPDQANAYLKQALALDPDHPQAQALAATHGVSTTQANPPARQARQTPADEGVFEMQWDCAVCGTKALLGKTHRFCPNCGASQKPQWRYFPSDEDKVAVADHRFVGRDKTCPACGELNAADAKFCEKCGSPLDAAIEATTVAPQVRGLRQRFEADPARDEVKEAFDAEMARVGATAKGGGLLGLPWWAWAAIVAVVLVVIGAVVALTATRSASLTVVEHSWQRTINVEQYRAVDTGSWQSGVPGDAYNRRCYQRQSGSISVPDGQTCSMERVDNGDGTFSQRQVCRTNYRNEPVYDTWCDFTVDRWTSSREVITEGTGISPAPYWGDPRLNCANQRRLFCEREAGRVEDYYFVLQSEDSRYLCSVPVAQWETVPDGTRFRANIGIITNSLDCNSLERETG